MSKPSKKPSRNWASLDWNRSTTDLARQTGVSSAYISKMRRRYAPDTIREGIGQYKRGKMSAATKAKIAKGVALGREKWNTHLDPELKAELFTFARRREMSAADVLEDALRLYLNLK